MRINKKRFTVFAFALSVSLASSYAYAVKIVCGKVDKVTVCCAIWGPDIGGPPDCASV